MMAPGSWQVRVQADGAQGAGQLSVPVPAVATRAKPMQFALGVTLFVMMIVLAVGLVSIVGAGVREGQLEPGMQATRRSKRRARILMGATAALVILILWAGDRWWTAEASDFAGSLYRPLQMTASIVKTSVAPNDRLVLTLANPAWSVPRKIDDFLPDHGHLMHLYIIRQPDAARVWHLHPEMTASGVFTHAVPPIPAGQYQLYGDVVHRDGLAETMVASLTVPRRPGRDSHRRRRCRWRTRRIAGWRAHRMGSRSGAAESPSVRHLQVPPGRSGRRTSPGC